MTGSVNKFACKGRDTACQHGQRGKSKGKLMFIQ